MRTRGSIASLLCAILSVAMVSAAGQEPTKSSSDPFIEEAERSVETAPVVIDGRTLFAVPGMTAYPAETRAEKIATRIETLAQDRSFAAQTLRLAEVPSGTQILGGSQPLMLVTDVDAGLEGVNRQILAHSYVLRIAEAIEGFRSDRQPKLLIQHVLYALAAVLILIFCLRAGTIAFRRADLAIEKRYKEKIRDLGIQSFRIVQGKHIWQALNGLLRVGWGIAVLAMVYACTHYVLILFPWTRGTALSLSAFVLNPLYTLGRNLLKAVPDITFLAVLAAITWYLLRLIRLFFSAIEKGTVNISGFDPAWAKPTLRLVRAAVIAFAIVAAYPYIPGSNSQAFKGVSLLIGLIFSFGSSSLTGNMISGYSLAYRRAFKPGDRVKIGEYLGDVQDSKLMVTYLRTIKNEVVAVPNSKIINEEVVNYSALAHTEGLILHTTVAIRYEESWRRVEAMLLEAAARTKGLLQEPRPYVRVIELGTFAITYEVNAYSDKPEAMGQLYTALHQHILDVFNEYGVQIMTPAYEGDPEQAKIVPEDQWYSPPVRPTVNQSNGSSASPTKGTRLAG